MPSINQWLECFGNFISTDRCALEMEYQALIQAYGEPQRHYHNIQHLDECFRHLEWVRDEADCPEDIQLALWYHDSVYDPRRDDNEQLSAQWAGRSLRVFRVPEARISRITDMILATAGHHPYGEGDIQLLLDIDLAILGAPPARFREYEQKIRQEYAWVPESDYRNRRRSVLEGFLARETIYGSEVFRRRLEKQARSNIGELLRLEFGARQ